MVLGINIRFIAEYCKEKPNIEEAITEEGTECSANNEENYQANEPVEKEEEEKVEQNMDLESKDECKQDANNNNNIEE